MVLWNWIFLRSLSWQLWRACYVFLGLNFFFFRHYLASEVHNNSTGLNSYKIDSNIFCSISACFLYCHYLRAKHKLPEFNSWPRVQCISPEIAFSVWDTTAKIAFQELNSYPIQDICSPHISHHTILYYLGHLYFHAPTVTSYTLLCSLQLCS